MGMVWVEFVTTSIVLVTTSEKFNTDVQGRGVGERYMLKGPGENTDRCNIH